MNDIAKPSTKTLWLLDTNILSELMKVPCDPFVAVWVDAQRSKNLFTSAVTLMEIRHGLERMPFGQRRAGLEAGFAKLLAERFDGQIKPFDPNAAECAGILAAARETIGRRVDVRDTMIAGIALANRMGIATRNTADFHNLDVPVINPFNAAA